jgi:hypothetical protein
LVKFILTETDWSEQNLILRKLLLSAFEHVASCEPSSDLVTLLHFFNPDHLFEFLSDVSRDKIIDIVLNWLKVCPVTQSKNIIVIYICFQKSQPLPEDLIQLWEDYQFMDYCEQIWIQHREPEVTWSDRDHCSQILSQACPSLIRILQAIKFLHPKSYSHLFHIHFLLDFSWDELRKAICSLRSLIHDEEELFMKLLIVALDPTLFPVPFDLMMWDLACGSLHVMQRILRGELIKNIM